jgi:Zn-dependent protease
MRDLLSWNIYLGRFAGVHVRLHAFFLLLAVVAVATRQEVPLEYSAFCLALFLASVVWHEFGHCFAALRTGGTAEQVLLWPLGGLVQVNPAGEPRQEWPTAIAGILANLLVCAFAAPLLVATSGWQNLPLNPLALPSYTELDWQATLGMLFWSNWLLVLANILPAYPLDGARLLRAALWQNLGYRSAVLQVARVGKLTALVLLLLGLAVADQYPAALVFLASLAIVIFFGTRQEVDKLQDSQADEVVFGYDFSQGYTSLEQTTSAPARSSTSFLRRWLERRRELRLRRQRELEEHEDLRVDDVLSRLHAGGFEGLSPEDRALLQRVSRRYRDRQRK